MARSTQKKFFALLSEAVKDTSNGQVEVVDDPQWANTGTFRLQPKDALRSIADVTYDFQDRSVRFRVVRTAIPSLGQVDDLTNDTTVYIDMEVAPDKLQVFLTGLVAFLAIYLEG